MGHRAITTEDPSLNFVKTKKATNETVGSHLACVAYGGGCQVEPARMHLSCARCRSSNRETSQGLIHKFSICTGYLLSISLEWWMSGSPREVQTKRVKGGYARSHRSPRGSPIGLPLSGGPRPSDSLVASSPHVCLRSPL